MAITSADRQGIVNNITDRLRVDGLYVDAMQNRVKYFRDTTSVPLSSSPFQTSGTHSSLDVIIDDFVYGITDYYSVSAIGISAIGLTVVDPISADGMHIGLKYNILNLKVDPNGQLNTIQDLSPTSIPTFPTISATNLTNGQIVIVSAGMLITSALPFTSDHGNMEGLNDDDHLQYFHLLPTSNERNIISAGTDITLQTFRVISGQTNNPL